jgi:hypothetical protein
MKKILVAIFFVIALATVSFLISKEKPSNNFVGDISNISEKSDLIKITNIVPNQEIENPVVIKGEARGFWFFEAIFPILIVDWDGKIIGQGLASADGEWMTEDFVPFTATIEFNKSEISGLYSNRGSLILMKSNMSDLPANDDALEFPVNFK